ncbi:MAG: GntR family transcriptional regulator [Betaproteobacteria bacterium]|nr:GntR family transcriptional regulator [Betaproteobacteria bacterium]
MSEPTNELDADPFQPQPGVALHHQIREDLLLHLRSGKWSPGHEIPSEEALCRHYGVSRGTVRQAISDLVTDGYVERQRGRGTFVSRPKLESGVIGSYSRFLVVGPPLDPGGRVLFCRRIHAAKDVATMMGLSAGASLWNLERVRYTEGTPVSLQTSFLPYELCPELARQNLASKHLIDVLRDVYGVQLGSAVEYIDPTVADGYAARHLAIAVRTPLFRIERTTYTVSGAIAEYRRAILRGDIYRYRIELR